MSASKKEVELRRLEQFRSLIPDFPVGTVESTEEPDFLIHGPTSAVGIELTDLYRETKVGQVPEQATEAMRKRVVNRAQEIYTSRQLPPVIATFFLDDRVHIKRLEVELHATQLADLVAQNIPAPDSTREVPAGWDDMQAVPVILHSLSVHRLDSVTRTLFSSPGATWVATLTREDIESALCSKEQKYKAYRSRCGEAWLVINSDIEPMATWFESDLEILRAPFKSSFQRAFLVQHFGGRVYELPLTVGCA